jgi:hypothetical protein
MHLQFTLRSSKQIGAERRRFILGTPEIKVFESRVDGVLESRLNSNVKAILEIKPFLCNKKRHAIRMQEAGQLAAWICEQPPNNLDQRHKSNEKFT